MKTTAANPNPATETFASAYSKLATIAEKLRGAGATACVDDLVLLLPRGPGAPRRLRGASRRDPPRGRCRG